MERTLRIIHPQHPQPAESGADRRGLASSAVVVAAIALLGVSGAVHLFTAPDQFGEAAYKGLLFLASAAGALLAAVGIWRGLRAGWLLGAAVAGSTALAYVISRTVGLPGLGVDSAVFEPLGVLSVVAETLFLVLAVRAFRRPASPATGVQQTPRLIR